MEILRPRHNTVMGRGFVVRLASLSFIIVLVMGLLAGSGSAAIASGTTSNLVFASSSPGYPTSSTRPGFIAANGRYVFMTTDASNIVANDTNSQKDAVLRDLTNGTYEHISISSSGEQANSDSRAADISEDGRHALFISGATNIVPGVTGTQVYLRDRDLGTTELVSSNSQGEAANSGIHSGGTFHLQHAFISNDGRFVVFGSNASNLVDEVTSTNHYHVYVKDRKSNTVTLLDKSASGAVANHNSFVADVNDDASYVVFSSYASNLVSVDVGSRYDFFLVDRRGDDSIQGITGEFDNRVDFTNRPKISNNGNFIAFGASSSNIVDGMEGNPDTDYHLYLYNRVHGTYELIDRSQNDEASTPTYPPRAGGISDSGRVVFDSNAHDLVSEDTSNTNTDRQVFMRDMIAEETTLVSVGDNDTASPRDADALNVSRDGRKVIFVTTGLDSFVSGSYGPGYANVFMRELDT